MKRSDLCTRSAQGHIVDSMRLFVTTFVGVVFGGLLGISFSSISFTKMSVPSNAFSPVDVTCIEHNINSNSSGRSNVSMIWDSSNPRGAERLPAGIVASQSDLYPHTFCDLPCNKDPNSKPKYLVTFTVGVNQKSNIDAAVRKFSDNFTVMLFHYDGRTSEWDEFEWSKRAIHVSVPKQTKWWYAKRLLHPDIVASFEYIFIWDEDLGVEHFDGNKYIEVIKKHKLEISQPGIDSSSGYTWLMTKKQKSGEVHKVVEERAGSCKDPHSPPCAAFVEIMAPVFSRDAWRCVWHMIQNDLVHGWGIDFAFEKCVEEPAHEKIGVVDSEWIVHQRLPSLGNQGKAEKGKEAWKGVRDRCQKEWKMFHKRITEAEATYNNSIH